MEEKGFQKIDLESQPIGKKSSQFNIGMARKIKFRIKIPRRKKIVIPLIIVGVLIVVFSVLGAYLGVQGKKIYAQANIVNFQAHTALDAMKQQNVELASAELEKTQKELASLQEEYKKISIVSMIPFFGGYYSDGEHILNASTNGINAAKITVDSLIPYADVLGLKGESSFSQGSAEDRIRLAVQTMGKVVPKIDDIEKELLVAKKEVDQINPDRYPEIGPLKQVKPQILAIQSMVDDGVLAVEQGKPLIKVLPELLGEKESKKYLILFQNDNEQRPTGGFLTFYAIFKVEQGVITVEKSSDIYDLDDSIPSHPVAPYIIEEYLPKVSRLYIRDSNLSPDFYESMQTFMSLYETSNSSQDVDGIIAIDTDFLVHILAILGEVNAEGLTFTADNDERCNCPQAVYVLNDNITRPVGYERNNRKSLLGSLLLATMNKALQSSPSQYWGPLFQQAIRDAQQKHIVMYLNNEEAQKGLEALNWAGRIKDFEGDYLHINDANFGGAKSNLYIQQSVAVDYKKNDKGEIIKQVEITYKNPEKHSDCNLERGGLCLNATLRNFQRMYVPSGSQLAESKGSEVKVQTKEELSKTYFESFFTVKPLGKSEISYSYTLPFIPKDGTLPILIQKQPGLGDIPYTISVDGELVEEFNLSTDKQLVITL